METNQKAALAPSRQGLVFAEEEIFGRGSPGRQGVDFDNGGLPEAGLASFFPEESLRGELTGFPELSEPEVIRHYTRLSQWNFGVDSNLYPLGSCTMKHNPRINEAVARLAGFTQLHPLTSDEAAQGILRLMSDLADWLAEITGLPGVTLQPAAGAHGEFAGLLMIRAALEKRGDARSTVLLPDSSHGTNPASAAFCGYKAVTVKSGPDGTIDMAELDRLMTDDVAAIMVTNPNTLGIFEKNIAQVAKLVHDRGGFVYCDGANLNALMGKARFGDMGVDVCHLNLHKSFSTPHGGGGPGAGPVCVTGELEPFLPTPVVVRNEKGTFSLDHDRPESVGPIHSFYGNVGVLIRAAAYILAMGPNGLRQASEDATLNANYVRARLADHFALPYPGRCLHEVIFNDEWQLEHGVSTLDIAKGLIDRGFHPPTIYFPLIVKGAMMIEPTETESRQTLDAFCDAMIDIAETAKTDPESLKAAPQKTIVGRLDEATAARNPELRCGLCG